jgi:amino acid transporter
VPAELKPSSDYVVSIFMEKIYGGRVAAVFTILILWTAFGSVFALLLGYSRIPFAAARDGYFFKPFSRIHPTKNFPHLSLLLIGVISIACSFVSLGTVIDALITTRILVQFIGQIIAVVLLRRTAPDMHRPYRIWLYPVPALIALLGWTYIFLTTGAPIILFGLLTLAVGIACFLVWSWRTERWPFGLQPETEGQQGQVSTDQ